MTDKIVQYHDKTLPNQDEHTYHFNGNGEELMPALLTSILTSSGISDPEQKYKLKVTEKFTLPEMASNPVMLRFYTLLTHMVRAKNVLEIGTFMGVSTMAFAEGLAPGGKVYTFEKFDQFAELARSNFAANGFQDRIELILGDAFEKLDTLPDGLNFDVIFIDGNKERYRDYFELLEPRLTRSGVLIVDDCFFHGDVLNDPPTSDKGRGTKDFLDAAAKRQDYLSLALPLSNGIYLMIRK